MATATKTARTIQSPTTCVADTGDVIGSAVDLRTAVGDFLVTASVVNGATGPTDPCEFLVQISDDHSTWRVFSIQTAGAANDGVYDFAVLVPASAMYVRTRFTGNTDEDVTVAAEGHEFTSIG